MNGDVDTKTKPYAQCHQDSSTTTVFYDGACPLCSREIDFYRKHDSLSELDWVDVSDCADSAIPDGLTRDEVLARFHVRLPDGTLRSGPRGFGVIWMRMKGFSIFGKILQLNSLQPFFEWVYRGFLVLRAFIVKRMGNR